MRTVWGISMRRSFLLLSILLVVLSASYVSAATIASVVADDCTFVQSSADCSTALSVSCQVYLTAPSGYSTGDMYLSTVTARINGVDYKSVRPTSGSYKNGTWVMYKNMSYADADVGTQTIDSISVKLSDGSTCTGSLKPNDTTTGNCFVVFNTYQIPSTCNCTYTNSTPVKNIDNTMTYVSTPGMGCSPSQVAVTYKVPTDYCDPKWTASYSACTGIFSNGTYSLSGDTTKSYTPGDGGACCSATQTSAGNVYFNHNGGSDCTAPPDQGTFECRIDPWAQYGDNLYGTGGEERIRGFNYLDYTSKVTNGLFKTQPVVFDFNRNGFDEIFTLDESSNLAVLLTKDLVPIATYSLPGLTYNQPAMAGLSDYGGMSEDPRTYNVSQFVLDGNNYVVVTANTKTNASKNGFVYVFNVTSVIAPVFTANYTNKLSGVNCYLDTCYFAELNGTGHKLDLVPSFVDTQFVYPLVVSVGSVAVSSSVVPIFASRNSSIEYVAPDTIVWVVDVGLAPAVPYVVLTDLNGFSLLTYLSTSPFGGTSGQTFKVVGSPVSIGAGLYWVTEAVKTVDNSTSYDVYGANMLGIGTVNLSSQRNLWTGVRTTGQCVSNPVVLKGCGGSAGSVSGKMMGIGVEYSASTATSGVSSYLDPFNSLSFSTGSPISNYNVYGKVFVNSAGTIIFVNNITSPTTVGWNVYDGSGVYLTRMSGSSQGIAATTLGVQYVTFDDENHKAWVLDFYNGFSSPFNYPMATLTVVDYSNMAAVHSVFSQQYYLGSSGVVQTQGPPQIKGDWMFIPVEATTSPQNSTTTVLNIFSRTAPANNASSARTTARMFTTTTRAFVAYDSGSDTVMTPSGYFSDVVSSACAHNASTCSMPAFVSSAQTLTNQYNFQTSSSKFLNGANPNLKIVASTKGSETITTLGCQNFIPLEYGSDSYIFGYSTSTYAFGYCDFSNELSPRVVLYTDDLGTNSFSLAGVRPTIAQTSVAGRESKGDAQGFFGYMTNSTNVVIMSYDSHRESPLNGSTGTTYSRALCLSPRLTYLAFNDNRTHEIMSCGDTTGFWQSWCKSDIAFSLQACRYAGCKIENVMNDATQYQAHSVLSDLNPVVVPSGTRCGPITKADVDVDGTDDIISTGGIASMSKRLWVKTFASGGTNSSNEWVLPVDVNADGYVELLRSSQLQQQLQLMTGKTGFDSFGVGSPVVKGVVCSVSPGTGYAQIQTAFQLPDPFYAQLEINPGDGLGSFICAPGSTTCPLTPDGIVHYQFGKSGTYSVNVRAFQSNNPSSSASGNCKITVNFTQQSNTGDCTLGPDGEFNFLDSILSHNWVGADIAPANGVLQLTPDTIFHSLRNCNYSVVDVQIGIYPRGTGAVHVIDTPLGSGSDGTSTPSNGYEYGLQFNDDGKIVNQDGEVVGTWVNDAAKHVILYHQDRSAGVGVIQMYYDGVLIYTTTQSSNALSGVTMSGYSGIDYVRVGQSGSKVRTSSGSAVDNSDLMACDGQVLQDSTDINVRRSYTNLMAYCGKSGADCSYAGLTDLTYKYPKCAKEIYNYCVYEAYYADGTPKTDSSSLTGASTCAAMLGIGAGYSGIAQPILSIVWGVLFAKGVLYGLLLIIIIIVALAFWSKKRGS